MTVKRVDPKEAKALMDQGWTYVDVRTEAEFEGGHPAGSVNIPMNDPDFLPVMRERFGPDDGVIIGCMVGGRSAHACRLLAANGFQKLVDQTGGWGGQRDEQGQLVVPGWEQEKLPTGGGLRFADLLKTL
jgi:rhodanese-related sulfurtransferase